MFSKEASRELKQLFWTSFGKSFPRKWILYNTKIKGVSFKFYFDTKKALVALDLEDDLENRITYWERLESLKRLLLNDFLPNAIFEDTYFLDNGKEISRIYVPYNHKVSIHNKDTWQEVMVFFNETMSAFEDFYMTYEDVIKP
ncbi:DUF4268 domain-containing protein [Corallibacter sp.]|uniref:DUF4268 domain-containing protein n=1 Tax=Corallibacter sp. TaxID=2038084 RepID=UPI003AB1480B